MSNLKPNTARNGKNQISQYFPNQKNNPSFIHLTHDDQLLALLRNHFECLDPFCVQEPFSD